jgi:uncharacterized protein YabN with tetrapyrrole methylase and pyrophosphatase domain
MHAQMAKESGHFDFADVCRVVNEKLVRRHPHVFGDNRLAGSDAVLQQWDKIKAGEVKRGPKQSGRFKDLPRQLPALMYAQDVYKQICKQAMDADAVINREAIDAEAKSMDEDVAEMGRKLFEIAAACRIRGIEPESALRRYTQKVVDTLESAPESTGA